MFVRVCVFVRAPLLLLRRRVLCASTHTQQTHTTLKKSSHNHHQLNSDFCYADETSPDGIGFTTSPPLPAYTYQPLWDNFGRLFEPLLSRVPFLHTPGNHVRFSC